MSRPEDTNEPVARGANMADPTTPIAAEPGFYEHKAAHFAGLVEKHLAAHAGSPTAW